MFHSLSSGSWDSKGRVWPQSEQLVPLPHRAKPRIINTLKWYAVHNDQEIKMTIDPPSLKPKSWWGPSINIPGLHPPESVSHWIILFIYLCCPRWTLWRVMAGPGYGRPRAVLFSHWRCTRIIFGIKYNREEITAWKERGQTSPALKKIHISEDFFPKNKMTWVLKCG